MQEYSLIAGLLLGLSSGIGCLGVCGPCLVPYLLSEQRNVKQNFFIVMQYLAGRLISYAAAGAAAGYAGVKASGLKFTAPLSGALMILLAVFLFISMLSLCSTKSRAIHRAGRAAPFTAGLLNGLHICPPFLAAIGYTITLGNIALSLLFFLLFFAGTAVYFIPFIFAGCVSKFERVKNAGVAAGFLASIWFLIYGILTLFNY